VVDSKRSARSHNLEDWNLHQNSCGNPKSRVTQCLQEGTVAAYCLASGLNWTLNQETQIQNNTEDIIICTWNIVMFAKNHYSYVFHTTKSCELTWVHLQLTCLLLIQLLWEFTSMIYRLLLSSVDKLTAYLICGLFNCQLNSENLISMKVLTNYRKADVQTRIQESDISTSTASHSTLQQKQ
jgi:hypothetical protein